MIAAAALAVGIASWFKPYQRMYDGMRVCAMRPRWLIGKRIRIVDVDNGRTSSCVVIGYGPAPWTGRVLDVSPAVRDDLQLLEPGVAHVRITLDRRSPCSSVCCCILRRPPPRWSPAFGRWVPVPSRRSER